MENINYMADYIADDGRVTEGIFKGWTTVLFYVPVGGLSYIFMPYDKINGQHSFEINLTAPQVKACQKQQNMFDYLVQLNSSNELAEDAVNLVKSLTSKMIRNIEKETSSAGTHFDVAMTDKEKVFHSHIIIQTANKGMAFDDAWMFRALPKEFWTTDFTRDTFMAKYFSGIDLLAKFYNTPEGIVALRAVANEISGRIFGAASDAMLDPNLKNTEEQQNFARKKIEKYRDKIISFDDKLNVAEKKAEGIFAFGGNGK